MQEFQTAQRVATCVQMLRNADRHKAFLIVEGSKDGEVYRRFACPRRCDIQWAYGRDKAIEVGRVLRRYKLDGFMVAVDQDEWILNKAHPKEDYIVWTDGRDLESTLMFAGVADRILATHANPEMVKQIERDTKATIVEHVIEWCAALGAMRWVVLRGRLGLPCKDIDAFECTDPNSLRISMDALAEAVINQATGPLPDARPLLKRRLVTETTQLVVSAREQKWLYCSGHDLCRALASGLREDFGREFCETLTAEALEATVRTAYAWSDFEATQLHGRVRDWEQRNVPFRVLIDRPIATGGPQDASSGSPTPAGKSSAA